MPSIYAMPTLFLASLNSLKLSSHGIITKLYGKCYYPHFGWENWDSNGLICVIGHL